MSFALGMMAGALLTFVIFKAVDYENEAHAIALLIRWRSAQGWRYPQTAVEQDADALLKKLGHEPGKEPPA